MGTAITSQQFIDLSTDAANAALIINGDATQNAIPLRLGGTARSLRNAAATIAKGDTGAPGADGVGLSPDLSGNLLDPSATAAGYISPTDGTVQANSSFTATGFVPCHGAGNLASNLPYTVSGGGAAGIQFYDSSKAFLAGQGYTASGNGPGSWPVPAGAYYCRLWWIAAQATAATSDIVHSTTAPTAHVAYNTNAGKPVVTIPSASYVPSRWQGKRLGLFGTSITAFNVWQQLLIAAKAMTITFDASIPGSHTGMSFDKLFAATSTAPSAGGAINYSAFATSCNNCDLILIEHGTNDLNFIYNGGGMAMGTDTTAPSTPGAAGGNISMGYVEFLLRALGQYAPNVPVIWITPYHVERLAGVPVVSGDEATQHYDDATLNQWFTYLQLKCQRLSVPVIDQRFNGINQYNASNVSTGAANMLADKLHPSTLGFNQCMAPYISRHVELFARSV